MLYLWANIYIYIYAHAHSRTHTHSHTHTHTHLRDAYLESDTDEGPAGVCLFVWVYSVFVCVCMRDALLESDTDEGPAGEEASD